MKPINRGNAYAIILFITLVLPAARAQDATPARRAKHSIAGKVFVGYQGWFRCPGDGSPQNEWAGWSRGAPSAATLTIDLYPDLRELNGNSLCAVPGMTVQGRQAYLFSSFPIETERLHFEWMRAYHIDGAFVQRFINAVPKLRKEDDTVLKNVVTAAEETKRSFLIEYDLSQAQPATVLGDLQDDWTYLVRSGITKSRAYLKDGKAPVVSIWGLGFGDSYHLQDAQLALTIVQWFKAQGCTVIGGVPASWGTLTNDSNTNPAWNKVYDALDIVQPWTVGRYRTIQTADDWKTSHLIPDMERTRTHGQLYMPVIFPGFSWHNLKRASAENEIPRAGGEFFWRQAFNARSIGAPFVKIAMFDEVNEGTAIFKAAPVRSDAPDQGYWLTLDADGKHEPADWYLQLARHISEMFHSSSEPNAAMPH
jgi:hypothetical protein